MSVADGSFCDMRRAGYRSFDRGGRRRSVHKPSTDASRAGFGMPYAANDLSVLAPTEN